MKNQIQLDLDSRKIEKMWCGSCVCVWFLCGHVVCVCGVLKCVVGLIKIFEILVWNSIVVWIIETECPATMPPRQPRPPTLSTHTPSSAACHRKGEGELFLTTQMAKHRGLRAASSLRRSHVGVSGGQIWRQLRIWEQVSEKGWHHWRTPRWPGCFPLPPRLPSPSLLRARSMPMEILTCSAGRMIIWRTTDVCQFTGTTSRRRMVEPTPLQVQYTCRRSVTHLEVRGQHTEDKQVHKKRNKIETLGW